MQISQARGAGRTSRRVLATIAASLFAMLAVLSAAQPASAAEYWKNWGCGESSWGQSIFDKTVHCFRMPSGWKVGAVIDCVRGDGKRIRRYGPLVGNRKNSTASCLDLKDAPGGGYTAAPAGVKDERGNHWSFRFWSPNQSPGCRPGKPC